jgi:hypothetical protein
MSPRTKPSIPQPNNTVASQLSALQVKLSNKESELAGLDHDHTTEAPILIRRRHVLNDELATLRDEEKLLQERLAREAEGDAAKHHRARIKRTELVLDTRLVLFKELDEAIEKLGRVAMAIRRLDAMELLPEVQGLEAAFAILCADWVRIALIRLASLGLGDDKRLDRSAPYPELLDQVREHHAYLLQELTDRPAILAAERRKQEADMATTRAHNPSMNY